MEEIKPEGFNLMIMLDKTKEQRQIPCTKYENIEQLKEDIKTMFELSDSQKLRILVDRNELELNQESFEQVFSS